VNIVALAGTFTTLATNDLIVGNNIVGVGTTVSINLLNSLTGGGNASLNQMDQIEGKRVISDGAVISKAGVYGAGDGNLVELFYRPGISTLGISSALVFNMIGFGGFFLGQTSFTLGDPNIP